MEFDDAIRKLGQFGKFQKINLLCCCLLGIISPFNIMGIVFIAGVPEHWCQSPGLERFNLTDDVVKNITIPLVEKNDQLVYSSCSRFVYDVAYDEWNISDVTTYSLADKSNVSVEYCSRGWMYDTHIYTSTIVSQWDIVCDNKWLQATASSVYMVGLMVGVLISGTISDMFGRKPTLLMGLSGTLVCSIATSFSPNFLAFCCMRFLTGFFLFAMGLAKFVVVMEMMGPDYRALGACGLWYAWAGGYLLYALIAYFIRDWFTLNLVASCSTVLLAISVFFIPESPRWLYLNGKSKQAEVIIRHAAKVNGVTLPDNLAIKVEKTQKGYIWDLCRTRHMTCVSANIFFNWFVNSFVYYGLSLNTSNLGGNAYLNFAIAAGVEIPGYVIMQVATQYGGRRWLLCSTMVLAGVALLCTMAVPHELNWIAITLAMIGKLGITISFGLVYVVTAEVYPTTVRTVGVGTSSFWARVGGAIAPLVAQLSDFSKILPLTVFGVCSVAAGLLALLLPETKGIELPETLGDGGLNRRNEKENGTVEVTGGHDNVMFVYDHSEKQNTKL